MIYLGVEYGTKFVLEEPVGSGETTTNLTPNAGFEAATTSGWLDAGGGVTAVLSVSTEWAAYDTSSLKYAVENKEATPKAAFVRVPISIGGIPVTAGLSYAFKMVTNITSIPTTATPELVIEWYNVSSTLISTSTISFANYTGVKAIELDAVAPATATAAQVGFRATIPAAGKMTAFIDGVQFEAAAVANGTFTPTQEQVTAGRVSFAGTAFKTPATVKLHYRAAFNDSTDGDYVGDLSPESSGLDAPEIREDSADRVEADGAIFSDFFAGKRPVILQGTIIATSKAQRNERVGKLRAASNSKTADSTLWWEDGAAGKLFVNLRRQQPIRITKGWVKEFQLSMVSSDSRILSYALKSAEKSGLETKEEATKFPSTVTAFTSGERKGAWSSVTSAKVEDGIFATVASQLPQLLIASGFGNAIPTGSVIAKMVVTVKGKDSLLEQYYFSGFDVGANITNGNPTGNPGEFPGPVPKKFTTTNANIALTVFPEPYGYIGWTPTPTDINLTTWGLALYFEGTFASPGTLSIDSVSVKVSYTIGPEISVENRGNVNAPGVYTITGPVTNPTLLNEQTGKRWGYKGALISGNKLVINTEAFTVVEEGSGFTGQINRYNEVAVGSDWLQIVPGPGKVLLAGESANTNTKLKVEYRDAWE